MWCLALVIRRVASEFKRSTSTKKGHSKINWLRNRQISLHAEGLLTDKESMSITPTYTDGFMQVVSESG